MKLKYYLMGLGIGIFVTTLVLSFNNKKEKLSDEEIIARARELGMVMEEESRNSLKDIIGKSLDKTNESRENTVELKDGKTNEATSSKESSSSEISDAKNNTDNDTANEDISSSEDENENNQASDADTTDKKLPEDTDNGSKSTDTGNNNNTDLSETEDYITFTVTEGMTSNQVARLLSEIGLIDDAKDFDNYIIGKGKSTVIRIGTYTLHKNSSYEEILKAITKSSLHN